MLRDISRLWCLEWTLSHSRYVAVFGIFDVTLLPTDRKSELGIRYTIKMILIRRVHLSRLGGVEFHRLAFFAEQLVLDVLKVSPISQDRSAITPSDTEMDHAIVEITLLDLIKIVHPSLALCRVIFKKFSRGGFI